MFCVVAQLARKYFIYDLIILKILVLLFFVKVLEVLDRSGRLKGIISTNVRQKRSGGLRAMTKKTCCLTTKKERLFTCERIRFS